MNRSVLFSGVLNIVLIAQLNQPLLGQSELFEIGQDAIELQEHAIISKMRADWSMPEINPIGENESEEHSASPFDAGGWVQGGYHNESDGLFNTDPGRFNFQQVWFFAERAADGSNGLDWGFRTDFLYGTDSGDAQSFGNLPGNFDYLNGWDREGALGNPDGYGYAMPQLYGQLANGDVSVIVGHFFTLLGYEVVPAPGNFFYSHSFTFFNSEAFTHTGALATWDASDNLDVYAGYTLGWDTGFNQFSGIGSNPAGPTGLQNGSSFLGGFSYQISEKVELNYITTFGDFGSTGDGYSHSIVADANLTENFNYVFQSDLLTRDQNESLGINQYFLYSLNEKVGVGSRLEWWKQDGASIYAATFGINLRRSSNFVVRPEIRFQFDPNSDNAGIPGEDQGLFGIDAILSY